MPRTRPYEMAYVHKKIASRPAPFMPSPKGHRHSTRAKALESVKDSGGLPTYKEFIDLCGATSDINLWLEVEEPELAEITPIRHTGMLEEGQILTDGPSEIYRAYKTAFCDDMELASWAAHRSAALDTRWQILSTFPAQWWLSQQPGWSHVFDALQWKGRPASALAYHHGLARFRLLHVIARTVGAYFWRKRERWTPVVVSPADIRKALGRVKALLKVMTPGVRLIDPRTMEMLSASLMTAETILEGGLKPNVSKKRRDETLLERRFLQDVVSGLDEVFGEASPTLVGHISSIAGYTVPETTLRRVRALTPARKV